MIDRGLCHKCAGNIIGLSSFSKVIDKFYEYHGAYLATLSEAERYLREAMEEPHMEEARLAALLLIPDAISKNRVC